MPTTRLGTPSASPPITRHSPRPRLRGLAGQPRDVLGLTGPAALRRRQVQLQTDRRREHITGRSDAHPRLLVWPRRSYRFGRALLLNGGLLFSGLRDSSYGPPKRRWMRPPAAGLQAHGSAPGSYGDRAPRLAPCLRHVLILPGPSWAGRFTKTWTSNRTLTLRAHDGRTWPAARLRHL